MLEKEHLKYLLIDSLVIIASVSLYSTGGRSQLFSVQFCKSALI